MLQRALAASALPRVVSLLPCFDCRGGAGLKGSTCRERDAVCGAEGTADVIPGLLCSTWANSPSVKGSTQSLLAVPQGSAPCRGSEKVVKLGAQNWDSSLRNLYS